MLKLLLRSGNYSFDFFETRKLHEFYDHISTDFNEAVSNNHTYKKLLIDPTKRIHRIYYIPPYFNLKEKDNSTYHKIELLEIDKGLLINLKNYTTVESYLNDQFSSMTRQTLRKKLRRLEKSFDISYAFYFGYFKKDVYDLLMNCLHSFIATRFEQRKENHLALPKWSFYKKSLYQMILDKNASIFVIYDGEKPIDVCINYHFENVTYNCIASFDQDYTKYSLGQLDIVKRLEWGLEKGYTIFDFYRGIMPHKLDWANEMYEFKHHIFFKKGSFVNLVLAKLLTVYIAVRSTIYKLRFPKEEELKSQNG